MPWQKRHPSNIPPEQWRGWLNDIEHPSPYLLPEWTLFWESVWPDANAELWILQDSKNVLMVAFPCVRRRRFGLAMCYAQPNGTPCGPLGAVSKLTTDQITALYAVMLDRRTVELAVSPDCLQSPGTSWTRRDHHHTTWIINSDHAGAVSDRQNWSESHRRNVARGERLLPRIETITKRAAADQLIEMWRGKITESRIALNRARGPALCDTFAVSDALVWRTAWCDSQPVATAIFLKLNGSAVYLDGAVHRDPKFRGVSHSLFAAILSELDRAGVDRIDLGSGPRGQTDPGLLRFKEGWGAHPVERTEVVFRRSWYDNLRRIIGRP